MSQKEEELKNILVDATELHPRVKELRTEIAKLHEEVESGNYEIKTSQPISNNSVVTQIQEEITRMQTSSAVGSVNPTETAPQQASQGLPNQNLYGLLLLDSVSSALARDMEVNERIYNMLLQRLETAKITRRLEASKEGTRYTILDPARLPLKPAKPNKVLTALIGFFLGAAAGAAIIFSIEFFDRSFLSVDEAKLFLRGPILGAISRITTEKELDEERKNRCLLGIPAFAGACVGVIVGTIATIRRK